MPAVVWEERGRQFAYGEGRVTNDVKYLVTDAFSESEVVTAIELVIPTFFNGLWFISTSAEEVGIGIWKGTVHYGIPTGGSDVPSQLLGPGLNPPPPPPPAADEALGPEWSGSTAGGTRHITTSIATRHKTKGFGLGIAPDNKRAIGASKTGVEGCDIVAPKFEFQTTRKFPAVSLNYLWTVTNLTGKTNVADFLNVFPAGSVLFLGADWNYRDSEGWSFVYRFSASPNKTAVNDSSTNPLDRIAPYGHDHVWVIFEDEESEGFRISVPAACYVEQVYEEGNFDDLGL